MSRGGQPRWRAALFAALCLGTAASACGKKGPPLPPLVLVPEAPPELTAVRRGEQVTLSFRIPKANADRSTPADLSRVDVFALTSTGAVTADDVVRRGTRVATLTVNKPKDPDEPESKTPVDPQALNQGDAATVVESVSAATDEATRRTYVVQGLNRRGRRGAASARVAVPLVPLPPTPGTPSIEYDETAVRVSWPAVPAPEAGAWTYSVYRQGTAGSIAAAPVEAPPFSDAPVVWDQERCYEVRAGLTLEGVRIEGLASPTTCVTPHDRFAPAKPEGLVSVASDGAISLIWSANREADLAGYLVLRAVSPDTAMVPITATPITETNFKDIVPSGANATYAIVAVDKTGNRSEPSTSTTETVR